MDGEKKRIKQVKIRSHDWQRWGPYLAERQWGTVREDYSFNGNCWDYFPHDHARSRAYRWGEDGLLGITDRKCRMCLSMALWNTRDPILKERLFGLSGPQGNHGEDVKELYYYLDNTPTHAYMKALYKYPQKEYPYSRLEEENRRAGQHRPEVELMDLGILDDNEYWDVGVEYCKLTPNDILCRYTLSNRGPKDSTLHFLPTVWYRNTWVWGAAHEACQTKPYITQESPGVAVCWHEQLGAYRLVFSPGPNGKMPELLFTNNETNFKRLYGIRNEGFVKDAFHDYIIKGDKSVVNPAKEGTKVAAHYVLKVPTGGDVVIRVRCSPNKKGYRELSGTDFDGIFTKRINETEYFYEDVIPSNILDERLVARQAYAGLLWSKQFYHYIIPDWLQGDSLMPEPPGCRKTGRNSDWRHLYNRDIISVPDKWEYPWYASWDLAFQAIALADLDVDFAKKQLLLFLKEFYMHPNGQIPAYEFNFSDVNPPVHAYAVLKVFKAACPKDKNRDHCFLAKCFHKLLLNFTWWVNRKDPNGRHLFSGGFLGFDNIGVFDRSKPIKGGGEMEQADGTAWMAFFALIMLEISLILAEKNPVYEDTACKFFEHFVAIVDAMNRKGEGEGLWDEEDGFYFDRIRRNGSSSPLKVRSMVGLIPFFSCFVLRESDVERWTEFSAKVRWFVDNRPDLATRISFMTKGENREEALLLSVLTKPKLVRVLGHMLDENEFLSPYGIRSMSKYHKDHPFFYHDGDQEYFVDYEPGESTTTLFGGNSNWRGPVWFCVNFLIAENMLRFDYFYGDTLLVECPLGSGNHVRLRDVSQELSIRLGNLFVPDADGRRPCHGNCTKYQNDPHFQNLILFYEYFHGDTGRGCGASHQTGWTALVANFLRNAQLLFSRSDSTQSLSSQP
ncbi:uncharacterized protein LOC135476728 [Liolophura sinensis]|uniref:uncharacterized protein LOC135476728 n=1 Tax=Liolophura sinensis TaxID=3198878 RepID=UPI0031589FF4